MDLAILAAEVDKPEYLLLSKESVADALNEKNIPHPMARVSIKDLKQFTMVTPIGYTAGGGANLWHIIKTKAASSSVPMGILWDLFVDPNFQSMDFFEGGIQKAMLLAGLDELVADAALIFEPTHRTALMTTVLALAPHISRAEQLGLGEVKYFDVGQARSLPNGN